MNSNKFELIGNVNYIDVKATDKGKIITKVLLGVYLGKDKEGNNTYDSADITLFGDIAEQFSEKIQKKDNVYFEGRISINKYTNKEGKEVKNYQFIANSYDKVYFDKNKKDFVVANEELPWNNK